MPLGEKENLELDAIGKQPGGRRRLAGALAVQSLAVLQANLKPGIYHSVANSLSLYTSSHG